METQEINPVRERQPILWKKWFFRSAGFGAGSILALSVVIGIFAWYQSRPKPEKPWNGNRLVVTRDYSWVSGEAKNVELRYVLENKTGEDFSIQSQDSVEYEVKLKRQDAVASMGKDAIKIGYPISVPAHTRKLLSVDLVHSYKDMNEPENGTRQDNERFSNEVSGRLVKEYPNVAAIQIRDTSNRVILIFPFSN